MLSTCFKTISCLALWGQRFAFITQNVHTAYLYWVLIKITCFITSSYHNYYFVLYILGILAEFNYYSMQSCIKAGLVIFGLFFSLISENGELIHHSVIDTLPLLIQYLTYALHSIIQIVELDLQIISFLQRKKNTIAIEQQQMSSNLMGNMWPVK